MHECLNACASLVLSRNHEPRPTNCSQEGLKSTQGRKGVTSQCTPYREALLWRCSGDAQTLPWRSSAKCEGGAAVKRRERAKPGAFEGRGDAGYVPEAATVCGSVEGGRGDALAPSRLALLSEAHLKQATSPSSSSVSTALPRSWRVSTNHTPALTLNEPTTRRCAVLAVSEEGAQAKRALLQAIVAIVLPGAVTRCQGSKHGDPSHEACRRDGAHGRDRRWS